MFKTKSVVSPVELMNAKLQKNLAFFSTMIDNIKQLNQEIESHIHMADDVIAIKVQEKTDLASVREQNSKIQSNMEALLK